MQVFAFSSLEELEPYADAWDRLAGRAPLRSWTWLSSWWRHYRSPRTRLLVLGVFSDADFLVGAAPWFLDDAGPGGRVIRPLGSGEVCSDYVGILSRPEAEAAVVEALADFLVSTPRPTTPPFRRGTCSNSTASTPRTGWPAGCSAAWRSGAARRTAVRRRVAGGSSFRRSWEAYLAGLSKGHRKQIRRLERELLDTGRAVLHTVERGEDLPQAVALLIDLHQRRRRVLGQRGCFASPRFAAFHREVMPAMLAQGQLQLHWLELDGQPVAAEYHLAGGGVIYAYQSGIEPAGWTPSRGD